VLSKAKEPKLRGLAGFGILIGLQSDLEIDAPTESSFYRTLLRRLSICLQALDCIP
jgi:hypothetical protein